MNRKLRGSIVVALFTAAATAGAADVRVMTQNQYLGGNIAPLIGSIGTAEFNGNVVAILMQIAANRAPDRVAALAREIVDQQPVAVGLQEVWKFECQSLPPYADACADSRVKDAFNDHLQLTQTALAGKYVVAGVVENLKIEWFYVEQLGGFVPGIPFFLDDTTAGLLRVLDRDAILLRSDVDGATTVDFGCTGFRSADGCNFEDQLPLGALGSVPRGYLGVDFTYGGVDYRFVNTHLEVRDPPVPAFFQAFQMQELLNVALAITPPSKRLVLVGDLNSDPAEPADETFGIPTPYWLAVGAELYDGWALRPGDVAGLTCCQKANLRNLPSALTQRIDHVFLREMPSRADKVRVIGTTSNYRLPPGANGLWPSDHGAVAAGYTFR